MDIYASADFIDKYVDKIKNSKFESITEETILKLNRIYQRENLSIDEDGYLISKSEEKERETRICNFFVVPIYRLFYNDGNTIYATGLGLVIYSRFSEEKFKRNFVNLSDEEIEKGNWLNISYIDRDLLLYGNARELYKYLRFAIKLSSRILRRRDIKVFYNGDWIEDDEAIDHMNASEVSALLHNMDNENDITGGKDKEAKQIVELLKEYTLQNKLIPSNEKPSDLENHKGWEDGHYFYLPYTKTWQWMKIKLSNIQNIMKTKDKHLDDYLIEVGVFESNEERSNGLKRADRNTSNVTKGERVFMINKQKMASSPFKMIRLGNTGK